MIHDNNLTIANGSLPMQSLGAGRNFYPFPDGYNIGGTINSIDLQSLMDLGRGTPITARFEITTSFETSDGGTFRAAFAIGVADNDTFSSNPVVLLSGAAMAIGDMVSGAKLGVQTDLLLPPLDTYVSKVGGVLTRGRRFLFLGFDITTTLVITTPLFSAGALRAGLLLGSQSEVTPHLSGWNAKGA